MLLYKKLLLMTFGTTYVHFLLKLDKNDRHFMWRPVCGSACPEHGVLNVCQGKKCFEQKW